MSFSLQPASPRVRDALWQVPAALALSALAFAAVGARAELIGFLYLAVVTGELCKADLTQRRLPNALVLPGYLVTATGLLFGWLRSGATPTGAVVSGVAAFVFLLLLSVGGGMGMGDVKLAGLLGLNLGTLGVVAAVAGPTLGFVAGGVAGLITVVLPGHGMLSRIPFGPYLLFGFWLALVVVRPV
jgi:leader peptidase (prepilin peptidase)/N-methyltransferase